METRGHHLRAHCRGRAHSVRPHVLGFARHATPSARLSPSALPGPPLGRLTHGPSTSPPSIAVQHSRRSTCRAAVAATTATRAPVGRASRPRPSGLVDRTQLDFVRHRCARCPRTRAARASRCRRRTPPARNLGLTVDVHGRRARPPRSRWRGRPRCPRGATSSIGRRASWLESPARPACGLSCVAHLDDAGPAGDGARCVRPIRGSCRTARWVEDPHRVRRRMAGPSTMTDRDPSASFFASRSADTTTW